MRHVPHPNQSRALSEIDIRLWARELRRQWWAHAVRAVMGGFSMSNYLAPVDDPAALPKQTQAATRTTVSALTSRATHSLVAATRAESWISATSIHE